MQGKIMNQNTKPGRSGHLHGTFQCQALIEQI